MKKKLYTCLAILISLCVNINMSSCSDNDDDEAFVYPIAAEMEKDGKYYYPMFDGRVAMIAGPTADAYLITSWWETPTAEYLEKYGIEAEEICYAGRYSFGGENKSYPQWTLVKVSADTDITALRQAASTGRMWVSPVFGKSLAGSKCATELVMVQVAPDRLSEWNEWLAATGCWKLVSPSESIHIITSPMDACGLTYASELLELPFVEKAEPVFADTYGRLYNSFFSH